MNIGIMGAMDEEIVSLVNQMEDVKKTSRAMADIYTGQLLGKNVTVVRCGIGKVSSAAVTQLLISEFGVTHLINTGLAGGIKKGIQVGDVVLCSYTEFFDVTPSVLEDNIPSKGVFHCDKTLMNVAIQAAKEIGYQDRTHVGHITTGDLFITDTQEKQKLVASTTAYCNDMESGAIAQVAFINNIPFESVRVISDLADENTNEVYYDFKANAPKMCNDIILKMLQLL